MNLYHGTNINFEAIDLTKSKPYKDFGKGFYLTDIQNQALLMAQRKCELEGCGSPIILSYEFDEKHLIDGSLNVKSFENVSEEWAKFIISNRNRKIHAKSHDYDIVIGPIADDGVAYQINRYMQGMIDLEVLVRELTFRKLNRQYFFGTDKAISYLKRL